MNDFQPVYPETINLDPYKRVRYSNGLVLGVDEFATEELYHLERNRLHNRALHGYGTVCGLSVTAVEKTDGWNITVGPGIAINPKGQEIRVPEAQCAVLDTWVYNSRDLIEQELGSPVITSPSAPLSAYLVLCYQECETDYVPVPSGPCQSLDKTSVASRIADDFKLELQFDPPTHTEDEKIQELVALLSQIDISDAPGGLTVDDIEQLVLGLTTDVSPPVYSPPLGTMHMRPSEVDEFIHTAFRVWVTDVRPELLPSGKNCAGGPPNENCVLLARIDFDVDENELGFEVVGDVDVEQSERPYLLQTRLLQEYLHACCSGQNALGLITSPSSTVIDETNLMHLTGDESIEGNKTFTDPLAFASDGRFVKHIMLPPTTAMIVTSAKVTEEFFRAGVPALKFELDGEVAFNITVPDDIEYNIAPRVRLVWGIKGTAPVTVDYQWQVRNRFADPGKTFGPFSSNSFSDTETNTKPGQVYITDFINLNDKVSAKDVFGAIRVKLDTVSPAAQEIYLLHVEINYIANRLGRAL